MVPWSDLKDKSFVLVKFNGAYHILCTQVERSNSFQTCGPSSGTVIKSLSPCTSTSASLPMKQYSFIFIGETILKGENFWFSPPWGSHASSGAPSPALKFQSISTSSRSDWQRSLAQPKPAYPSSQDWSSRDLVDQSIRIHYNSASTIVPVSEGRIFPFLKTKKRSWNN